MAVCQLVAFAARRAAVNKLIGSPGRIVRAALMRSPEPSSPRSWRLARDIPGRGVNSTDGAVAEDEGL